MKKFIFTVLIYLLPLCLQLSEASFSRAIANQEFYAKITTDQSYFYQTATETTPLFVLPQSYFVVLTGEKDDFYCAKYKDLSGYVRKNDVSPMSGTPITPFFSSSIRMFLPDGAYLYSQPSMSQANQITKIDYLNENISFYGSIEGEVAIPKKSNIWHYCKLETGEIGYVYSVFCDSLLSPPSNNESFDLVTPNFDSIKAVTPNATGIAFIIIGVSIPCLVVLYLLVKPNLSPQTEQKPIKITRRAKRDYFEFDESDLN